MSLNSYKNYIILKISYIIHMFSGMMYCVRVSDKDQCCPKKIDPKLHPLHNAFLCFCGTFHVY